MMMMMMMRTIWTRKYENVGMIDSELSLARALLRLSQNVSENTSKTRLYYSMYTRLH
jgi:hypothetical protein